MPLFTLFFLLGVICFQVTARLPSPWLLAAVLLAGFLLWRLPGRVLYLGLLCGYGWSLGYTLLQHPAALPDGLLDGPVEVCGEVTDIPRQQHGRTAFIFVFGESGHRTSLNWYRDAPRLRAGEHWCLTLRLKPVHGYSNPGGFDYEGWLYRQGVRYQGYVQKGYFLSRGVSLHGLRQALAERLESILPQDRATAVLRALVVGDRSGLDQDAWQLFSATGTSHLVAISGLHVGMLAGLMLWLVDRLWRRVPFFCRRIPAAVAAAPAALLVAMVYAALAGFALPTQRALIMLTVLLLAVVMRRPVMRLRVFSLALLLVLLHDPAAVLQASFWLSFGAVGAIMLALAGGERGGGTAWVRLRRWLLLQPAVFVGLLPVLMLFNLPVAPASPLVNILAIPWFGLFAVPLSLGGTLLLALHQPSATAVLSIAHLAIDWGVKGLEWATGMSASWSLPIPQGILVPLLALVGVLLLLLPRYAPGRLLGLICLLPLLFPVYDRPQLGEFDFSLLDVGQGLSAVVRTKHHVLLYDAGPGFASGFDTGQAVVVPYLRSQGIRSLDLMLLSHSDTDHVGGAESIIAGMPVSRVLSGEALSPAIQATRCHAQSWQWDGVDFELLSPGLEAGLTGNDASCVLRVGNAAGSVLLTGDIERRAESLLAGREGARLASTLCVAPHHGSRSSSGGPLVDAVAPRYVLYSAGFRNRWGMPHPEVRERWQAAGALGLNTMNSGMIGFRFGADGTLAGPVRHRFQHERYWHWPLAD